MDDDHGLGTEIPYERDLIQRAISAARPKPGYRSMPRWALVKKTFGTGEDISRAICTKYGFDPDQKIFRREWRHESGEEKFLRHVVLPWW